MDPVTTMSAAAVAGLNPQPWDPPSNILPPVVVTQQAQRYVMSGAPATRAMLSPSGQSAPAHWYETRGVVLVLSVVVLFIAAFAAYRLFSGDRSKAA